MMLTGLKTAFFLFLQAEKEGNHSVMLVNDLSSIPEKKDKNVSFLNHGTVWNVKRSTCSVVSFRTELAARIFASGYSLDLAEAVDGIPEKQQKELTAKFKCQKTCSVVSFRTELAARIFASGYSLDLAEAVDGIPEKQQKELTAKFKCQKLIDLRLPWLTVKTDPNQQKERIISGKFK